MTKRIDWVNALTEDRPAEYAPYFEALVDALAWTDADAREKSGHEAVDVDLISGDGYVFLWSDILSAEEIVESLLNVGLTPTQLAKIAVQLVSSWERLRSVRIRLTPLQFIVLREIRKGVTTRAGLQSATNLDSDMLEKYIAELTNLPYGDSARVVEDVGGRLSTIF